MLTQVEIMEIVVENFYKDFSPFIQSCQDSNTNCLCEVGYLCNRITDKYCQYSNGRNSSPLIWNSWALQCINGQLGNCNLFSAFPSGMMWPNYTSVLIVNIQ